MANFIGINRRDILRGLGVGAAFFSPLARSLRARAAAATGNFMVFYTPNGHVRSAFGATGSGASFALKASLLPLEPYKAKLSVCANLDNPGASSKASHEDCTRTLTCVTGGDMYRGYGPSIDWVVANQLGSRPITLASLWRNAPNWQSKISWKSSGVFDAHLDDANAVYNDLFAKFVPSQTPGEVDKLIAQGKSVLDFVKQDAELLAPRLPAGERVKMTNHLDALRQLEKGLSVTATAATCSTAGVKGKVDAGAAGATGGAELQRAIETKIDLATTAFSCGVRRAATLLTQGASGGRNPLGGIGHHNVSHYEGANPTEVWKQIDKWYAERFAYLLKRLTDLQIIDTTVVAWATEISEAHSQNGFVIPVAGGSALGLQPMQTFAAKGTLSNLWVSVQKAFGVASETFGNGSGGVPGLLKV